MIGHSTKSWTSVEHIKRWASFTWPGVLCFRHLLTKADFSCESAQFCYYLLFQWPMSQLCCAFPVSLADIQWLFPHAACILCWFLKVVISQGLQHRATSCYTHTTGHARQIRRWCLITHTHWAIWLNMHQCNGRVLWFPRDLVSSRAWYKNFKLPRQGRLWWNVMSCCIACLLASMLAC